MFGLLWERRDPLGGLARVLLDIQFGSLHRRDEHATGRSECLAGFRVGGLHLIRCPQGPELGQGVNIRLG